MVASFCDISILCLLCNGCHFQYEKVLRSKGKRDVTVKKLASPNKAQYWLTLKCADKGVIKCQYLIFCFEFSVFVGFNT
jgi:hypothetical protein